MKRLFFITSMMTITSLIIAACNIGTSPGAAGVDATQPPATDSAGIPDTGQVVPIDLAGPPMEVGSTFVYVDGSILAAVPGGTFKMGYNNYVDTPEKEVSIGSFWIYSSEVTNSQYAACVNKGLCTPPNAEQNPAFQNYRLINLPVVGVTYQQATDYCSYVLGRLPTEAEWEKSARGPEGNLFPWGDGAPSCDLLNFNFCKDGLLDIRSYPGGLSFYGLFDMSGNVREWVSDWYAPDYYTEGPSEDPLGPETGQRRSVRSSSFSDSADFTYTAHRFSLKPEDSLPDLGFRCVVNDPIVVAPSCVQMSYTGYGPNGEQVDCSPQVFCNDVNVSQVLGCEEENVPYTIVTFSMVNDPPSGWTKDAPGCDPLSGDKFQCYLGDGPQLSATGSCMLDDSSCTPGCPAHYTKEGDSCVWDGSGTGGTECIAGSTYDPVNQCCTADPGAGADVSLCPAGSYPLNGVCVSTPSAVVDSVIEPLGFDSCKPREGDDDTPCTLTCNGSCEKLDPNSCTCVYDNSC